MVAIMNPSSQQLITMPVSNHLKYLPQPNLNCAYEYLAAVFNGTDKVVVGLISARPSFLQILHLFIQW